jgi:hypothetical protein
VRILAAKTDTLLLFYAILVVLVILARVIALAFPSLSEWFKSAQDEVGTCQALLLTHFFLKEITAVWL